MDDIVKLVNCPCCFEVPKPGPRNDVGLCSNGHLVCYTCFSEIQRNKKQCPVCRTNQINQSTSHYMVNGLLSIISAITVYNCKYAECNQSIQGGQAVVEHEKTCLMKPIKCPKSTCNSGQTFQTFASGQHKCLTLVPCLDTVDKSTWHFTINIEDLFSVDSFRAQIMPQFCPRLLTEGISPFHQRLCINATNFSNHSVFLYTRWLDTKEDTPPQVKKLKSHIYVYVNTKSGSVGYSLPGKIFFQDETFMKASEGIYLNSITLQKWLEWTNEFKCTQCKDSKRSHLHVKVSPY